MVNPERASVNRKSRRGDKGTSAGECLRAATERLRTAGVESARREAEELLAHALRRPRAQVLAERDLRVNPGQAARFAHLLARRTRRVPLQYLLGTEEFAGLRLRVGPGVLIPRPETELLVEEAVRLRPRADARLIADLGTGSGNLALALAVRYPAARIYGTDLSERALYWARLNRRRCRVSNVRFLRGRGAAPIPGRLRGGFDMVVSNPPYISLKDRPTLQPEVRREPASALFGGTSGLEAIRFMAKAAGSLLRPGGIFICEIGIGQESETRRILVQAGLSHLHTLHDWQDIPRIISATYSK